MYSPLKSSSPHQQSYVQHIRPRGIQVGTGASHVKEISKSPKVDLKRQAQLKRKVLKQKNSALLRRQLILMQKSGSIQNASKTLSPSRIMGGKSFGKMITKKFTLMNLQSQFMKFNPAKLDSDTKAMIADLNPTQKANLLNKLQTQTPRDSLYEIAGQLFSPDETGRYNKRQQHIVLAIYNSMVSDLNKFQSSILNDAPDTELDEFSPEQKEALAKTIASKTDYNLSEVKSLFEIAESEDPEMELMDFMKQFGSSITVNDLIVTHADIFTNIATEDDPDEIVISIKSPHVEMDSEIVDVIAPAPVVKSVLKPIPSITMSTENFKPDLKALEVGQVEIPDVSSEFGLDLAETLLTDDTIDKTVSVKVNDMFFGEKIVKKDYFDLGGSGYEESIGKLMDAAGSDPKFKKELLFCLDTLKDNPTQLKEFTRQLVEYGPQRSGQYANCGDLLVPMAKNVAATFAAKLAAQQQGSVVEERLDLSPDQLALEKNQKAIAQKFHSRVQGPDFVSKLHSKAKERIGSLFASDRSGKLAGDEAAIFEMAIKHVMQEEGLLPGYQSDPHFERDMGKHGDVYSSVKHKAYQIVNQYKSEFIEIFKETEMEELVSASQEHIKESIMTNFDDSFGRSALEAKESRQFLSLVAKANGQESPIDDWLLGDGACDELWTKSGGKEMMEFIDSNVTIKPEIALKVLSGMGLSIPR